MNNVMKSLFEEEIECEGCKKSYRNIYDHQQQCRMWHMFKVLETKNKAKKKKEL